jgi:hypothetical protein
MGSISIYLSLNLEMDYWVVVVYLLEVHCINAGLAYQARKEVIDLESLVEANTDKPHIVETLISYIVHNIGDNFNK